MKEEIIGDAHVFLADNCDVLPSLKHVDAVITDPPYAIPTQIAATRTVVRNVGDLSVVETAFRVYITDWKNLLGETGRIFVFCDGASYSVIYRAAYSSFNLAALVWDKGRIGMGREFRKRHELIVHGWGSDTPVVSSEGHAHDDILEFSPISASKRVHPAEKPVSLIRDELLRVCGEVILDPFMGSGSTGVAALQSGRKFIGVEIEPKYFEIACSRLEEITRNRRTLREPVK